MTTFKTVPALNPSTHGLTKSSQSVKAGEGISTPFTVNKTTIVTSFGFFKFMNELSGGHRDRSATITTKEGNSGKILASASGRSTTADTMNCRYADDSSSTNESSEVTKLPPGTYFYNAWPDDGKADSWVLGHQNN